ncbi:ribosomal maturation YjgA family protein [Spirosoma radiotolerans]|uniref:DUF2809 domain-containing protein n=1 Tax=Spirosoma radiotolerans TaxID=1379870 RepID=A0A0E3V7E3_9BACT|nr:DUF2809 domain-containing protein [Spirosoma radiotolerans]AKD55356.1 hypothetical protein SD10_11060 [Spirosoma radiotolerans]
MQPIERNRILYSFLTLVVILLGLASRHYFGEFPFVRTYVGDGLWALMVFFGFSLVFNRWSVRSVAIAALLFSFGIELSQLYHTPWIDRLRSTRLGGLVLGFSFLWSDLLSYSIGIAVGVLLEIRLISIRLKTK